MMKDFKYGLIYNLEKSKAWNNKEKR